MSSLLSFFGTQTEELTQEIHYPYKNNAGTNLENDEIFVLHKKERD